MCGYIYVVNISVTPKRTLQRCYKINILLISIKFSNDLNAIIYQKSIINIFLVFSGEVDDSSFFKCCVLFEVVGSEHVCSILLSKRAIHFVLYKSYIHFVKTFVRPRRKLQQCDKAYIFSISSKF